MLAEIVTIGDELCRGEIVDTNSSWLAESLWDLDITAGWMTSCRDVANDIRAVLSQACARAEVVLVSGGLGPTEDDLTVDVVADLLGVEPVIDEPSRERMERRFAKAKFRLTPNNIRQAHVPAGARVFLNSAGLAPGFLVDHDGTSIICVPGFPRELKAIWNDSLEACLIELREARGERVERIAKRIYRVFGKGESHVAEALENVTDGVAGASLHYQVKFPEIFVKLVVRSADEPTAAAALDELDARVRARVGRHIHGVDEQTLPKNVVAALLAANATMATAESCTGGMVGQLITSVPGSSACFMGGAITYSNAEKTRQLGVHEQTLIEHGAVSEECVIEMAQGARKRFGVDYAVAISGIAGPGGGTEDKPVGLVHLALAGPRGETLKRLMWPAGRDRIRTLAAHWALALVLRALQEEDNF